MIELLFTWADGSTLTERVRADSIRLTTIRKARVIHDIESIEILSYAPIC